MNRREFLGRVAGAIAAGAAGAAAIASDGSGGLERERMAVPRVRGQFTDEELQALRQPFIIRQPYRWRSHVVIPPCEVYYFPPHADCHCAGRGQQ